MRGRPQRRVEAADVRLNFKPAYTREPLEVNEVVGKALNRLLRAAGLRAERFASGRRSWTGCNVRRPIASSSTCTLTLRLKAVEASLP